MGPGRCARRRLPHAVIPPTETIPETSPFRHEAFLATALALPLRDRYHPGLPLRYKAQVVRLLPKEALPVLPRRKQYFTRTHARTLARQADATAAVPRCVEAGLPDAAALAAEDDPAALLVVTALERWLAGAEKTATPG